MDSVANVSLLPAEAHQPTPGFDTEPGDVRTWFHRQWRSRLRCGEGVGL